jgi:acetyl esterase/lipase
MLDARGDGSSDLFPAAASAGSTLMSTTSNTQTRLRARIAVVAIAVTACVVALGACSSSGGKAASPTTSKPVTTATTQPKVRHTYPHVTTKSTFAEITKNPAFAGFGPYLLPTEVPSQVQAMQGATPAVLHLVKELKAWDPQTLVNGFNFLIDQVNAGNKIWYPLYSAKQVAADPSKKTAGLWFIPGEPGKPLAVIAPGGGFTAVASLQEGFPLAQKLHEMGYNVAIVKYRVNSGMGKVPKSTAVKTATDDLAVAMTMLRDNAAAWNISLDKYSTWGSSAGGEIMNAWAADAPTGAKAHGFDPPAVVIDAYTPPDQTQATASLPPYFIVQGADDQVVNVPAVDKFVRQLKAAGADVKYTKYPAVGHGFGIGVGTSADGWYKNAVAFWQAHMNG